MKFIPYYLQRKIEDEYPIQTGLNNPILRTISKDIVEVDQEIRDFLKVLHNAQILYDWVGLAAPQIWKNIRAISIAQLDKTEKKYYIMWKW